jgi:hypothetical protein
MPSPLDRNGLLSRKTPAATSNRDETAGGALVRAAPTRCFLFLHKEQNRNACQEHERQSYEAIVISHKERLLADGEAQRSHRSSMRRHGVSTMKPRNGKLQSFDLVGGTGSLRRVVLLLPSAQGRRGHELNSDYGTVT